MEAPLVPQLDGQLHTFREGSVAASSYMRSDEEVVLVAQAGFDRRGGEMRAGHR